MLKTKLKLEAKIVFVDEYKTETYIGGSWHHYG